MVLSWVMELGAVRAIRNRSMFFTPILVRSSIWYLSTSSRGVGERPAGTPDQHNITKDTNTGDAVRVSCEGHRWVHSTADIASACSQTWQYVHVVSFCGILSLYLAIKAPGHSLTMIVTYDSYKS